MKNKLLKKLKKKLYNKINKVLLPIKRKINRVGDKIHNFIFREHAISFTTNYVAQFTIHPWAKFHYFKSEKEIEINAGFVSVYLTKGLAAGFHPVLSGHSFDLNARDLSLIFGRANTKAYSFQTFPLSFQSFTFDCYKAPHYTHEALSSNMIESIAGMTEVYKETKRKPVKKNRNNKRVNK